MIQRIRIDRVLQEALTGPFRNLVTRPTGAAVRSRIEAALADSACDCALLDFSDVELIDVSCADEVIAKLLLRDGGERYVVLAGLNGHQRSAIHDVLQHHGLAVAALPGNANPDVLGQVSEDSRVAFAQIASEGPLDAERLAARETWTLERAEAALAALVRLRLVRPQGAEHHPLPVA